MNGITVLLADDHSVVLEGLKVLLQAEADITVVGLAQTGAEAVEKACSLRPDVVVMDIAMPLLNGMDALRLLRERVPATRVLVLSAYSNPSCIDQVIALGATGYLIKKSSIHVLAHAIRQVNANVPYFDPSIEVSARKSAPPDDHVRGGAGGALTPREMQVLKKIAAGLLNKQIASELGISAKTSEKHRYSLMEKLNIHDTAGLTQYAMAAGLTERDGD